MADKPVGTIFVELDLDASRYSRGQQQLLKDAQQASTRLEDNFRNLGIKSAATFDLMRAKTINSFEAIAKSSKSTADDIIRAEEAKNAKLQALNEQQFGKQTSIIENFKKNWIAASVAVFGAYQTIGKALDMAEAGSKLQKQEAAFENLAKAANASSSQILDSLKRVSQGMVSDANLIQSSGKALLMGLPSADIVKYMEIAAATSKATGQTVTEAFNDITLGVSRQSRMILDNLGIIISVEKANEDYARVLGKTSAALTDAEKRQAFANATMRAGEDMIKRIGSSQGALDGANKLVAAQANLWDEVDKSIARILDGSLSKFAAELTWIEKKLKGWNAAAPAEDKRRELNNIERTRSSERFGLVEPGTSDRMLEEFNRKYLQQQYGLKPSEELKRTGSFTTPGWNSSSWREREGRWAEFTADELKAMKEEREKYLKEVEEQAKKEQERIARIWADYRPRYVGSQRSEAELADEKAMEAFRKYWADYEAKVRSAESQQSEAMLADQKVWEDYKKKLKDESSSWVELSAETARAMQSNFSDLFFDAMTGKLKSLGDYSTAIFTSVQRAAADMAGQMLTQKIFGTGSTGGTSGGGGWLGSIAGWIGEMFGSGSAAASAMGNVFAPEGMTRFASGGVVTRPTFFAYANGGGVMGEAGPEAIMPLKRDSSGRLGVSAPAQPAMNVTINVAAPQGRVDRESLSQMQTALYSTLQRAGRRNA